MNRRTYHRQRKIVEVCPKKCPGMAKVYFPSVGTRAAGDRAWVFP